MRPSAPVACGQENGLSRSDEASVSARAPLARSHPKEGSMGLYAKHVLPRVIDVLMRNKDAARLRAAWIPKARGEVLEIGIGSGLNLGLYSSGVTRVYGVDPSAELQRMARERASRAPFAVEFLAQSSEEPLPLAARSIDTIVVTWSLCSIPDASRALEQARRVLKP